MNKKRGALGCAALIWLVSGCGSDGGALAPTYDLSEMKGAYPPLPQLEPGAEETLGVGRSGTFALQVDTTLAPSWEYDCLREHCAYGQFAQLQPAPDGVWLATLRGGTSLVHLTSAGELAESFTLEADVKYVSGVFQLSVNENLEPTVGYYEHGRGALFFVFDSGSRSFKSVELADVRKWGQTPLSMLAGPGGTLLAQILVGASSAIHAYDSSGKLLWKQGNLREVDAGDVRFLSRGRALVTQSGKLVLRMLKDRVDSDINSGLTVLDSSGHLLWDLVSDPLWRGYSLTKGPGGSLALAGTGFNNEQIVYYLRDDATLLGRVQSASLGPDYVTSMGAPTFDPAGNLYVQVWVGVRGEGLSPALCKLPAQSELEPRCVALSVTKRDDDPVTGLGLRDMVAPEPNVLIGVVDRPDSSAHALTVVRYDF